MIVLVCGGRDFYNSVFVGETLDHMLERPYQEGDLAIVQGGAAGADQCAEWWCNWRGVACFTCRANWQRWANAAGSIRNAWMIQYMQVDACIAFPGGNGTANMVKMCRGKGIPVYLPTGKVMLPKL